MIASSTERVPRQTAASVNRSIQWRTDGSIAYFRDHRDEIPARLAELDVEWDVERALAAGSSCLSLAGLVLGLSGRRRWFLLPLAVQGFYLQHTLQGWCPPLPLLRRLGFRTPAEIERERCALAGFRAGEPAEPRDGLPGSRESWAHPVKTPGGRPVPAAAQP